jgi:WD40 repeat protein
VWDTATGAERHVLRGHPGDIQNVRFVEDGRRIAAGGNSYQVTFWDAASGQAQDPLEVGQPCGFLDLSPDERHLALECMDAVQIWDVRTRKLRRTLNGHKGIAFSLCVGPGGRHLATSGTDETVRIWDVAAGRELHTLRGHSGVVFALDFSPDGRRLLTGGTDGAVKVWDVATGQEVLRLPGHATAVTFVGFTPDGSLLISGGSDGVAKVWDGTPRADGEIE